MVKTPWINNPLVYLFDLLEQKSRVTFATYNVNEVPKNNPNIQKGTQPYMEQYQSTNDNQVYKYLYDPDLDFNFRFHQRISSIKYQDRKQPWVTLMYNMKQVNPLTNVVSSKFNSEIIIDDVYYGFHVKRVSVPINLVFVSNSPEYLYHVSENLVGFFDRLINFNYKQAIKFSDTCTRNFDPLVGQCLNITPVDLTKLDTEMRGTLMTTAYTFDLVYFTYDIPVQGYLLKEIDVEIKILNSNKSFYLVIR